MRRLCFIQPYTGTYQTTKTRLLNQIWKLIPSYSAVYNNTATKVSCFFFLCVLVLGVQSRINGTDLPRRSGFHHAKSEQVIAALLCYYSLAHLLCHQLIIAIIQSSTTGQERLASVCRCAHVYNHKCLCVQASFWKNFIAKDCVYYKCSNIIITALAIHVKSDISINKHLYRLNPFFVFCTNITL